MEKTPFREWEERHPLGDLTKGHAVLSWNAALAWAAGLASSADDPWEQDDLADAILSGKEK